MKPIQLLQILSLLAALLLSSEPATAYPVHRRLFRAVYQKSVNCTLCHADASGSQRTSYAKDWAARDASLGGQTKDEAFRQIESLDSDGDGFTNLVEIRGGSNPGDAKSTPSAPGRRWQRNQAIPIPVEQLKLVFGQVESMEASEPSLSPAQRDAVESGSGGKLDDYDLLPTLFLGLRDGVRHHVASFAKFPIDGGKSHFSLLASFDTQAKLFKVALFSTGTESGSAYMPFLRCIEGKAIAALRWEEVRSCPGATKDAAVKRKLIGALSKLGWTIKALASEWTAPVAATGSPPGASSLPRAIASRAAPTARVEPQAPRLRFERLPSASRRFVVSNTVALALLFVTLLLYIFLIVGSVRWALRTGVGGKTYRLSELAPSLRLLAALTLAGLLLAQLFGGVDVYVQTRMSHDSALEYFQHLSWPRLLGISHAHLFGFSVMYGLLALMLTGTNRSETFKCSILSVLLWSGIFDVLSWWGTKAISPRFEWLSLLTGSLAGVAALGILAAVTKSLLNSQIAASDGVGPL